MDPITISSLLAAAAGALGSEAIKDLYQAIKNRIKAIVGEDQDVIEALEDVEEKPQSKVRRETLEKQLAVVAESDDKEIHDRLQQLAAVLKREGSLTSTSFFATQSGPGGLAQGYKPVASGAGGVAAQNIRGPVTTGPNSPAFQGENITVVMGENSPREATQQVLKTQYLKEVVRETNLLPWGQMHATYADPGKGEQLGLADIYTDLDTQELRPVEREDELRRELASQTEDRRIPALEKLNQESRLLIMGDPGSGKSTFAKHVAYVLAQSGLKDDSRTWLEQLKPWEHGAILPVWVELKELAGHAAEHKVKAGKASAVRDYLKELLDSWSIPESWVFLEAVMKPDQAKALVVLDGLDEVPQDQRMLIVDVVNDLVSHYSQHRYVVTCRPYAYIGQPWKLQNFHHVTLAPFNEKQIEQFVENWYQQLTQRKRLSEHDVSWRMKQLQTQAIKRKDLRGLAERPLLLMVMVQLHTFQGKLPDDRTELYNDAVDLLMERWQQRLGQETGLVQHLNIPHLKMTDLRDGLCEAAFQAHQSPSSEETPDIRESDLRQCLQTYLGGSWDKAGQFVQYIRERSGLLIPHKIDAYRFPHRTFQEFLAACYLLRTDHDPGRPASLVQQILIDGGKYLCLPVNLLRGNIRSTKPSHSSIISALES